MGIENTHPNYDLFTGQWSRCRDCLAGTDAIKNPKVRETYLPRLLGQDTDEYKAYVARALFFGIAARIHSGLVGTIVSRPAKIDAPKEMLESYLSNDISKVPYKFTYRELLKTITSDLLNVGRIATMVDRPVGGGMPYIINYPTENVINWFENDDGYVDEVVIAETILERDPEDKFKVNAKNQYRHIIVRPGQSEISIYTEDDLDTPNVTLPLLHMGQPLDTLPVTSITSKNLNFEPVKPPMLDIIDVNLSHYKTSADLEHGRHFTALPTPVISGAATDKILRIGSQTAWVLGDYRAKAYFLEFTGQGLQSLETALAEKQAQMSQFSVRLMDTSTRGSEAVETVKMRHSSEVATISDIAISAELAMNETYNKISMMNNWGPVSITLDKNFLDGKMSPTEFKEQVNALANGQIDEETFIYNLQRGDMIPPNKTHMKGVEDA